MTKQKIVLFYFLMILLSMMSSKYTQASIVFSKANTPYYFTEDYIVTNNDTIIINAGVTIIISPGVNIITNGVIIMDGSKDDSVFLLPEIEGVGWGMIEITCPNKTSIITNTTIVDGIILSWYCNMDLDNVTFINNQNLSWDKSLVFVREASANIINSSIYGSNKGEGFQIQDSENVVVKNCFFSNIPDAVELINCVGGNIRNNRFEDIPDDAIDLNNCINTLIDSNVIINVTDRGMEIGSENFGSSENIIVERNVIVNCKQGIIFKEDSHGKIINNTFYNNQVSVKCVENNVPKSGSNVFIENCIFSNSQEADIFHDETSIVSINYCLTDSENLPGEHNIVGNPLFINISDNDFYLQENSPCINAGNPSSPLDPDQTICDIGAYYYNTDTTSIDEYNEVFNSLQVYPNPFENEFKINWMGSNNDKLSVILYNLEGLYLPIEITSINTAIYNQVNIKLVDEISASMLVVCKVSINGYSKSYLLYHK